MMGRLPMQHDRVCNARVVLLAYSHGGLLVLEVLHDCELNITGNLACNTVAGHGESVIAMF